MDSVALEPDQLARFKREVERDPSSPRSVPLANALRRMGQLAEAEAVVRAFLTQAPGRRRGEFVLARVLLERGALDEALLILDRLYPRDSENVTLTTVYAEALIEAGRVADARAVIDRGRFIGLPPEVQGRLLARIEQDTLAAPAVTLPGAFLQPIGDGTDTRPRRLGQPVSDTEDPFAVPVIVARLADPGSPAGGADTSLPLDRPAVRLAALRSWAARLGLEQESC